MSAARQLDIRLLGELTVQVNRSAVPIAGRQQQALLTLLAFRVNRVVTRGNLIDALWGPAPPPTAESSLRVSVSKLRRALDGTDSSSVLVTRPEGYLLRVDEHQTDLGRFRALLAEADGVLDAGARARLLSDALTVWGGPPSPGVDYDAVANGELQCILELHDLAVADKIDCDLALGRHRELVPELAALVAHTPLSERPHAQLMLALSRSGRQAEALDVHRRFRTRLINDLGIEPSAELKHLQRSILAQDEASCSRTISPTARPELQPKVPVRGPKRRLWKRISVLVGAVSLGVLLVGATVRALSTEQTGTAESGPAHLGTVARLHPVTGSVIDQLPIRARIPVGDGFGTVVVGQDAWVLNSIDQTISRVDMGSGAVTATIAAGADPLDLALVAGDVWVTNSGENRVTRIDAETEQVVATVPVGLLPEGVVEAGGDVWVANHRGQPSGSVWRIDADSNTVLERIPVGAREFRGGPQWLAAGAGSVWVGVPNMSAVVRIDPERNAVVATVPVTDGGVCGQIVADDEAVWVASGFCGEGLLTRIDPRTNRVVTQIKSPGWSTVFGGALGLGSLWITTDAGPFEVDTTTNEVVSRLALAGDTVFGGDLAVGDDSLWVHDAEDQSLIRIDPLTP